MKITLNRWDLRPECRDIDCDKLEIGHFKPDVQAVIGAAGVATFREFLGSKTIRHDGGNGNQILLDDGQVHKPTRRIDLLKSINGRMAVNITSRMAVSELDGKAGELLEWCTESAGLTVGDAFADLMVATAWYAHSSNLFDSSATNNAQRIISYMNSVLLPGAPEADKLLCLYNASWWMALWAAEVEAQALPDSTAAQVGCSE